MITTLTLQDAGTPSRFNDLSLSKQFAITGGAIMLLAGLIAGYAISAIASRASVEATATASALFMESLLSPLLQDLATEDVLPPKKAARLNTLIGSDSFRQRFPHLEIWKEGGPIAYSTTPELIGRTFPPPPGLLVALSGRVSAQYTDLGAREHVVRHFDKRYLEIYVPIREHLSDRIIAIAEIHEATEPLEAELSLVRLYTWIVISAATLVIMLGLYGVVYRGSRVIESQRSELRTRIDQIERVSALNAQLKQKAQKASSRVAEATEALLRRVGADLHDGPAQLVGFAALKVEHVRRARNGADRKRELQAIDAALSEAIDDIRNISKGLMLPEIEHLSLPDVIERAVHVHARRTGMEVKIEQDAIPAPVPVAVKLCVYRFLQEGLNNAFRHAAAGPTTVACRLEGGSLVLVVRDGGTRKTSSPGGGLGLIGLKDRAESLGGSFSVETNPGGSTIEIRLPLIIGDQDV